MYIFCFKMNGAPLFVPGVWGPYNSVMIPGLWTSEGGQSAAGKLIDHVVENHSAYSWIKEEANNKKRHIHDILNGIIAELSVKEGLQDPAFLTKDYHVWPDYHGNRSPLADPTLKGMISGLTLSSGVEDLARQYLATVQALAYSTRHIMETMTSAGHDLHVIHICGGLSNNKLYVQAHADITGLPIVKPHTSESVLLGAAILGACASGKFKSTHQSSSRLYNQVVLKEAMKCMGGTGDVIQPDTSSNSQLKQYHCRKYKVFLKMLEHQRLYEEIMNEQKDL